MTRCVITSQFSSDFQGSSISDEITRLEFGSLNFFQLFLLVITRELPAAWAAAVR